MEKDLKPAGLKLDDKTTRGEKRHLKIGNEERTMESHCFIVNKWK